MALSLIQLLRQRYLDTISSVQPVNGRWKVLIVDGHSQDLLNNVLKPFEILELNVQQIMRIENQRAAQPSIDAVYLLAPTSDNVDRIIADFAPPSQPSSSSKKHAPPPPPPASAKYAGAWVYFIDGIEDSLAGRLTSSPAANSLRAFSEIFTNFAADESHVFTLRPPNSKSFLTLFAPPERTGKESLVAWQDELEWISKSIVNILATLGEEPYIRYYNPSSQPLGPAAAVSEQLCRRLANRVQQDLDAYCRNSPDFPPKTDPPRPKATLLITDRSMDLVAPLLHEFTYQAMCHDLLDIDNQNRYRYAFRDQSGGIEEKEVLLSDEDKVWCEVRHLHMKDALDKLVKDFRTYAGEHGHMANGKSLNDMKDMLANLPQLRESKEKLSLHLTMAETCMDLFEKKRLPLVASVEQSCATGMTPEGKTPKTIVEEMVPLLDDRSVSSVDKVRIIALYILFRDGVPEEDKRRLYQHARLGLHEMDAVNNLVFLGANVSKESGRKKKALFRQQHVENAYEISRYQPAVKMMLEEQVSDKLDRSTFPYTRDMPSASGSRLSASTGGMGGGGAGNAPGSLRSSKPQWQKAREKRAPEARQRLIVFVAGGVTMSEVRCAYTVGEELKKDIVIGSTHIFTPKKYVEDLSNMDRAGGSSLLSHGAPASAYDGAAKAANKDRKKQEKEAEKNGAFSMFQQSVDRRFATSNPAPPPNPTPTLSPPPAPPASKQSSYSSAFSDPVSKQSSYSSAFLSPTAGQPQRPALSAHSSSASFASVKPIPSISGGTGEAMAVAAGQNAAKMEEKKKRGFFGRSKK